MRTMMKLLARTLPALQALVPPRSETDPPEAAAEPDAEAAAGGVAEPEPGRVLGKPERPMGYVDPQWISPVVREYFP